MLNDPSEYGSVAQALRRKEAGRGTSEGGVGVVVTVGVGGTGFGGVQAASAASDAAEIAPARKVRRSIAITSTLANDLPIRPGAGHRTLE
jgi:hypothetical protein